MTTRRRWVLTPTDASAVMAAHRLLSSVVCSNDDIDWHIHFLLKYLPGRFYPTFLDVVLPWFTRFFSVTPPSTIPWNIMIFGSVSWRQTWPKHVCRHGNLRRLTVNSKSLWRPARILTCCHSGIIAVTAIIPLSPSPCQSLLKNKKRSNLYRNKWLFIFTHYLWRISHREFSRTRRLCCRQYHVYS